MEDDYEEKCVRRFCWNCGHHAKQIEKLRMEDDPIWGRRTIIDANKICPKCGKTEYSEMEIVSDHPTRKPMENSQRCYHCGEVVSYKFKDGDEVTTCPKCGREIAISTFGATPDKPISDFTDDELRIYGINTRPSFMLSDSPSDWLMAALEK